MASFIKVAKVADVPEGSGKLVEAGGKQIALFNAGGKFFAIDNTCKHRGGPLVEGELDGTTVVCPWHGWSYDISTGCKDDEPDKKVACFAVKVEGDDILIEA